MSYFKNNGTNYTQVLAEYAANLTYDKIPAEVIERAKLMTLHTLGVSLAAKMDELAQNAVKIGSELNNGVGGSATVWTTGEKLSPANAVFVNGTISDILDWEDCSWTGHPSASAVPVSIAVAEDQHVCVFPWQYSQGLILTIIRDGRFPTGISGPLPLPPPS